MVYIQLNCEQEKASLSFELSLKKFPHVRKFKTLTRDLTFMSKRSIDITYYRGEESCRFYRRFVNNREKLFNDSMRTDLRHISSKAART